MVCNCHSGEVWIDVYRYGRMVDLMVDRSVAALPHNSKQSDKSCMTLLILLHFACLFGVYVLVCYECSRCVVDK